MKRTITIILLLLISIGAFAQKSTKLLTIQYGNGSIPPALKPKVAKWLADHFDYNIGGHMDLSSYPNTIWAGYQDGAGAYTGEFYSWVHEVAAQNGYTYEDMILHINRDYAVPASQTWLYLDQFDNFEQNNWQNSGAGSFAFAKNGAFTKSGMGYTDVTVSLYDNKHTTKISDKLFLGYAEPFDLVNINVATGRAEGSATWQYWNGSTWVDLTLRKDTTEGITKTGAVQFNPPPDWSPTVVNGSRSKYWVRLTIAGASTAPVLSKVFGDDWFSHSGTNNCRGWSKSDANRINVGMGNLEYNPTPPANATARFRYQARSTGAWAHNYTFMNPTNKQKGQLTWITTLLWAWTNGRKNGGMPYKGIFIDDVAIAPGTKPSFNESMSDDLPPGTNWQSAEVAYYAAFYAQAKSVYGPAYPVGANTGNNTIALALDFTQHELSFASWVNGNAATNNFSHMDDFLPGNNPRGAKSSFAAWDNQVFGYTGSGVFHLWDMANRTPINVLATYYTGSNPNTMFQYNTLGWSYYDTDEYYFWSPTTATLSAPLNTDLSTGSKTISLTNGKSVSVAGGPLWRNTANAETSSQAANIKGYALKIGDDIVRGFKDSNTSFHTFTPIVKDHPAGTAVQFAVMGHQATDPIPDWHNIWYWANYFPAMSVDIGQPDPKGWKAGTRDLSSSCLLPRRKTQGMPAG